MKKVVLIVVIGIIGLVTTTKVQISVPSKVAVLTSLSVVPTTAPIVNFFDNNSYSGSLDAGEYYKN